MSLFIAFISISQFVLGERRRLARQMNMPTAIQTVANGNHRIAPRVVYNQAAGKQGSSAMKSYTMETAAANFAELMDHAQQGLVVYIVGRDGCEYELKLTRLPLRKPRTPGSAKGRIILSDDFYEPLPEFEPYMK